MKKHIILLLAICTLWACASEKESEISLFNDITFKLMEGEKAINVDLKTKEAYESYASTATFVQIPLFKAITSKDYTIYLGLPINTTVQKLADLRAKHINTPSSFDTDNTSYFYTQYQSKDRYIAEYCKVLNGNTIYILTASNTPEMSNMLFNLETLSNRLSQK